MAITQIGITGVADDAIGLAKLSASGTASNSTFLRGDNTWSAPGGGDLAVMVFPGMGAVSSGVTLIRQDTGIAAHGFPDAANHQWECMAKVPFGATSIASIKMAYATLNTNNLFMKFETSHGSINEASWGAFEYDTTDSNSTYSNAASANSTVTLTVPSAAYNGLSSIQADDIIGIRIHREGADNSDTYGTALQVLGLLITFA